MRPPPGMDPRRLLGVDGARGLALIGMMAVHITPSVIVEGTVSTAYQLASGRAAALFAVLAGVGIALATGASNPPRGRAVGAAVAGTGARAFVLLIVGLTLGAFDSGVAVVLTYYAGLFVVAIPFLRLSARVLLPLAAIWALAMPFISFALRQEIPRGSPTNPTLESVVDPGGLALELTLTGYYPVLTWTAYVLLGLGLGRLNLRALRTQVSMVVVGASLAIAARIVSWLLLESGGMAELRTAGAPGHPIDARPLEIALQTGFFGTTPTSSWWWLAAAAPHSSTPFNLLHTMGVAIGVLGAMLLLGSVVGGWLWPLAAMGSMTLTLYSLHVVLLATAVPREVRHALLIHVLIAAAVAIPWRSFIGRGPLEIVAARTARLAASFADSPASAHERLVGKRIEHGG